MISPVVRAGRVIGFVERRADGQWRASTLWGHLAWFSSSGAARDWLLETVG